MELSERQKKVPFYYGWVIVLISALGVFFSGPGQTYSVSIFINSYIQEFGWSRSLVSAFYSAATLCSGFMLSKMGRQIDGRGHRTMVPLIAFFLALACLWMSFVALPLMLVIGFFMLRFFGQGSMTLGPSTLVPQWFNKKRGRAFSLMTLGGVAGSAIIPPLNHWLIVNWGWRLGWRFWAVMLLVVMVPLARILIRNKPHELDLMPDGDQSNNSSAEDSYALDSDLEWTLGEAKGEPVFWYLLYCGFVPAMVNTGVTFHLVSIMGNKGMSASVAAMVLSMIAITAFPVTFITGYLLDRLQEKMVMAAAFIIHFLAIFLLLLLGSFTGAVLFALLQGIAQGMEGININVIWPNYFGHRYLGSIRGYSMRISVIGSALGPLPFGVAYDYFGNYNLIIILMLLFPLLAIVASLLSTRPEKASSLAP